MADTITVTIDQRTPAKMASQPFGMVSGTANITALSATKAAVTAITGLFNTNATLHVVCDGVSSGGYAMRWDTSVKAFRAYQNTVAAAPLAEVTSGNAGTFNFIVLGQLG